MRSFLAGANTALCFVAALFFLRFWRQSHDRFYVFFSLAFLLLGANAAAVALVSSAYEEQSLLFALRLLAFLLILVGIVDKNRSRR